MTTRTPTKCWRCAMVEAVQRIGVHLQGRPAGFVKSAKNEDSHRVFPHVTRACKGVPLETVETAKHDIEKTETTTGLKVVVRIIDKVFETGRKYASDFRKNMTIHFDELLPKWNYTASPQTE